ncbi:MAG: GAF domain-containing protein [Cyclobacteriaceae bacterium]
MLNTYAIPQADTKQQRYNVLLRQIRDIIYNENDLIANLGNIAAILHQGMNFSWTGFYFVEGEELILGPFQGPAARTRIGKEEGVCGTAFSKECTVMVQDVEEYVGHISLNDYDKSEIAIPAYRKGEVSLVLNINSHQLHNFTDLDKRNLQQVMHLIEEVL